jgi:hypothetical protein
MKPPYACEICNYTVNDGCVHYWHESWRELQEAASRVADTAFVTQLNDRKALLKPVQRLQSVLFERQVRR